MASITVLAFATEYSLVSRLYNTAPATFPSVSFISSTAGENSITSTPLFLTSSLSTRIISAPL